MNVRTLVSVIVIWVSGCYSAEFESGIDVINLSTCGAKGPTGPTQKHCDMSYHEKIRVMESGRYAGVQVWTVPETNVYSILALGAQGGKGARNMDEPQRGDYVHAKIKLMKGDLLHVLVGQQGGSACDRISERDDILLQEICLRKPSNSSIPITNISVTGGGGGGGGATVVFKIDKVTHLPIILMVAGGGGGLPFLRPATKNFNNTGLKRIAGKPYPVNDFISFFLYMRHKLHDSPVTLAELPS
ncbi:hypothetical protein LOTGIDRAFT_155176 [Lottia gigantea]|uniref:receptor protein-tyrosine kinase n=1 Tax=Lottia gigantea TaxID=225164 RepID=V3ZSY6_LOTGI|nr:hypothetical protein LOTGIDRAFT_155176 [Lottia gigantea]ESO85685.1 hypothetical protein LOTGIDRAFT_155176 [Lottia gigantea]